MDYFESEGKTIEEALQRICDDKGFNKDELEYMVLAQKKKVLGFIGRDSIQLRAWKRVATPQDGLEFLNRVFLLAGLDCTATCEEENEDLLLVNVGGSDVDLLVGRNGELLDSLQYLANKHLHRRQFPKRILVDADGFRQRRVDGLKRLALKYAEQVKATGETVTLAAMNAHDRRIVHLELKDHGDVLTRSLGEGPFKKVLITTRRPHGEGGRPKRR
jgi:spoIIIJ-associated protein